MFTRLSSACTRVIFGESLTSNSEGHINFMFLNNHPYQSRPTLINLTSNEPLFYSFSVSVNKCGPRCNTSDDSYFQVCVSDKVKSMNVKVLNLRNVCEH